MVQAITATYVQEDEDWTIKVAGLGKELNGRAPGIIAARDRADQLVEKLAPEGSALTVVHLLNGSALEFTTAYMTARLARTEPEPEAIAPEKPSDRTPDATQPGPETTPKAEEPEAASQDQATAAIPEQSAVEDTAESDKPDEPGGKRAKGKAKRSVPRKELSKSPETTARKADQRAADSGDQGEGADPGRVAAAYGGHHTTGQASATG